MFQTKPTTTTILVPKPSKLDNVIINVAVIITTHSQVLEHVLRGCESVKEKTTAD
jgi:hypothetical protein